MTRHILTLTFTALLSALASTAAAQSMNVRVIVNDVAGTICPAFMAEGDIRAGIAAAGAAGYGVVEAEPDNRALETNPDAPPRAVTLRGSHSGTLYLSMIYGVGLCGIGLEEGTVQRVAEFAGPHMEALALIEALAPARGPSGVGVWEGESRRAVVYRSPHHAPGVELLFSFVPNAPR